MSIKVNGVKVAGIGIPGKSAYQSAKEAGYQGTEEQFSTELNSIKDKQNKITGSSGQVVGFDSSGNAIAQEAPSGLPEGGTQGQLLAQGANGAEWVDNPVVAFGPQTVAASAWASDSTYSDYPYRASIALSGVTANHVPNVNFNSTDALSGKLSPVSESYDGGVYIYATEALTDAVNVGSITCIKAVSA